ncbi:MAG: hypothetical protein NUW12_11940 [Firmicutes bacterium]|jgi:MoaA/NifB/PqqE/SkfB family radical SAM enzyme|nr:hypothetical protein [Bacillota bacterium]
MGKMRHASWFLTVRCNFDCPYCWERLYKDLYKGVEFPSPQECAAAWNRIPGELLIDISGGEPFLYRGLFEFFALLDSDKKIAISTNASGDIAKFIQVVPPERCVSITLSYHPSNQNNMHDFVGKALCLKNRGYPVVVNFVMYPEQMWLFPKLEKIFGYFGVPVHADPYGQNPRNPAFTYNEAELEFLRRYVPDDRRYILERRAGRFLCDAGDRHFVVMPDGEAYECLTRRLYGMPSFGNIFDPNFGLATSRVACEVVACATCDYDHTSRVAEA